MLGGGGKVGSAWYDLELRDEGFLGQVQSVGQQGAGALSPLANATSEVEEGLDKAGAAAEKTGGRLGRFGDVGKGAVMGVGLAVGNMAAGFAMQAPMMAVEALGNAISLSSDKAEAASKVNVLFGDSAHMIEEASKNAATSVGMSSGAYLESAGNLGNLLTNFDITGDAAANMSNDMIGLAADMGSFNNASSEEVVEAMGAAFRGETEPIRRFGVMLDAASVSAKAVEMGLADSTKEVSASARAQATYQLILEQTTAAQGDFARTSDGLANSQRIAGAKMEDAMTRVGDAIAPLAATVVPMLADAFVFLIDGVMAIVPIFEAIFTATQPLRDVFVEVATHAAPLVQAALQGIGAFIEDLGVRLGGFVGLITNVGGALIDFADAAIRAINLDWDGAAAAAQRGMDRIGQAGTSVALILEGSSHSSVVAQKEQAEQAAATAAAVEQGNALIQQSSLNVSDSYDQVGSASQEAAAAQALAAEEAAAATEQMASRIREHIDTAKNAGFESGAEITSGVAEGMMSETNELGDALDTLKNILTNGLTPEQQANRALGAKWISTFREGLDSGIPGAREAAQTVGVEALQALSQVSIGSKEAKRIGEIVDDLYASGMTENQIVGALAAQGVGFGALSALGRVKGWDQQGIADAVDWAGGLSSQEGRASNAGSGLGGAAKDGIMSLPWGTWGMQAGVLFGTGINSPGSAATVRRESRALAGIAGSNLRLQSPAKEGPLSEGGGPEGWGERFAELFGLGIDHGMPRVDQAVNHAAGRLASLAGGVDVDLNATTNFDRWGGRVLDDLPARGRGRAGGGDLHLHVGVLVADDGGVRQLQKRLDQVARHWERG